MRVERLRAAYQIGVKYTHFPLHPDTPEEGLTLEQLFAGRDIDIPAAKTRMVRQMADESLDYGDRTMTYNSRALADTLVKIAEQVGLHIDEAREVLDSRRFKEAVDADWQRSSELGVTGVPTFVAGGRVVVGAQPYEELENLVISAGTISP